MGNLVFENCLVSDEVDIFQLHTYALNFKKVVSFN